MNGFHGLTWDHPRGYRALEAAAEKSDGLLRWSRQPLEGFESHPIVDLAARFDLLVLDHPHIGEAVAHNCLQPLEAHFDADEIAVWDRGSIGATLASYRWEGSHYALPLDVAMQVMARDPDTVVAAPDSWDEVMAVAERSPVAISVAGPHAVLTFLSLCISLGEEPGGEELIGDAAGREALELLRRLAARAPAGSRDMNPIALLEAIARRAGIVLVPLVFGYVNYTVASGDRSRVAFSNAPRLGARRGSVLGGTGIGITSGTQPDRPLLDHLRWLMSKSAQQGFIPQHDGQPSSRAAWESQSVNAAWGDFYRDTRETAEQAWVRPRFDGYIAFQTAAAALIREALGDATPAFTIIGRLRGLWQAARAVARGPL